MKRGWIFLILIVIQLSVINADSFTITWGSSSQGGEFAIGGTGIGTSFIGSIPSAPPGTPPPIGGTPPSGGGTIQGFSPDKNLLVVTVRKGIQTQQSVTITNNETSDLQINISITDLGNFIFPNENNFILKPGESKSIIFSIYVSESETRKTLTGKINFMSKSLTKSVDVILDIKEKTPLFDIKTDLLRKVLIQGQKAFADVKIVNLGDLKNIDVELESFILDKNNQVYDSKKETFTIGDSVQKQVFLKVPKDISLGNYIFSSKVSYKDVSAQSYDSFKIIKSVIDFDVITFWIIVTIIITSIMLVLIVLVNKIKK